MRQISADSKYLGEIFSELLRQSGNETTKAGQEGKILSLKFCLFRMSASLLSSQNVSLLGKRNDSNQISNLYRPNVICWLSGGNFVLAKAFLLCFFLPISAKSCIFAAEIGYKTCR